MKITIQEAIERVLQAVEYYEMVHDTGEEKQNEKNKNYVWKGFDRLVEICNKKQTESEE
jgi:hypothetical protein|tara:strand:+ start:297 stop:473 length:177 start_codon:yes stop_codon:yes gene_type:complete